MQVRLALGCIYVLTNQLQAQPFAESGFWFSENTDNTLLLALGHMAITHLFVLYCKPHWSAYGGLSPGARAWHPSYPFLDL